jgi:hypothetical protein
VRFSGSTQYLSAFGLALCSGDYRFDDWAYVTSLRLRLPNNFGSYIECSWTMPGVFQRKVEEWTPDWWAYLTAVIADDRGTAPRLAKLLDIGNQDAPVPKALYG